MADPVVYIIDDDKGQRQSLRSLFEGRGYRVSAYANPEVFGEFFKENEPSCLILDFMLEDNKSISFLAQLCARPSPPPVIMISGYGDVPTVAAAFKAGALDFFEKPLDTNLLTKAVKRALMLSAERLQYRKGKSAIEQKLRQLSDREREVFDLLTAGHTNKSIALKLGIVQKTVEVHRKNLIEKCGATSLADLIALGRGTPQP